MTGFNAWDDYRYRVSAGRMVTPVIRELWLEPIDTALPYEPGQYVLLGDADWQVPQRSFSVANAPRPDGSISVLVTLVVGGETSQWAHGLQIGDEVLLEGPFGTFVTEPGRRSPVLLLGAGSGLAPCRALAEALLDRPAGEGQHGDGPEAEAHPRPVTLFFSGRTEEHAIDQQRFEQWDAADPAFTYLVTLTRDTRGPRHTQSAHRQQGHRQQGARIPALLAEKFDNLDGWEVFAAGPSGFVTGCEAAAKALGAAAADIRTEEFFVDPTPWTDIEPETPARQAVPVRQEAPVRQEIPEETP